MNRQEFIKSGLTLGLGMPFLSLLLNSCSKEDELQLNDQDFITDFSGKVIIIGAGAAGLSAGYLLNRYGVDFQIIEASDSYGGRVKRDDSLADFSIDLGAEWIHDEPSVLAEILNDPSLDADIGFIKYNPQSYNLWHNGKLNKMNFARNFYSEYKFKKTSWYGFFEKYMVPHIEDRILLNCPVKKVEQANGQVNVEIMDGSQYRADKVLVTVPIKILQSDIIQFNPPLSDQKRNAINSIQMGAGLKAFIEFEEKFYADITLEGKLFDAINADDKIYYDAAFRKDSDENILGLFTINEKAERFTSLDSEEEIIALIISDLDEMYEGQASKYYKRHVIQNWSKEPYIMGSYSYDFDGSQSAMVETILEPVNNMIYFAGEALSLDSQATVHGACYSGMEVTGNMIQTF